MSNNVEFNKDKGTYSVGDTEISAQDARDLYSFMQREYEREDMESNLDNFLDHIADSYPNWEYDDIKKLAEKNIDDILYEYHENEENNDSWYYSLQNAVELVIDEAINKADMEKGKETNNAEKHIDAER